jgi:AcrR family transcriptional regulator
VTRKLTERGRERRRQILDMAAGLFAERGYHPTAVADIVEALGVGKGVFYWYFASKEELFLEILRDAQHQLRRRQEAAIVDEPDPVCRIELGIRASIAWFDEHRDVVKLLQFASTEERFAPVLRRGQDVAVADTARHVKEGIVEGRIRDLDPFVLSHAVLGVTGHLAREFVHERSQPVDDVAEAAVAFCLEGLLGGK